MIASHKKIENHVRRKLRDGLAPATRESRVESEIQSLHVYFTGLASRIAPGQAAEMTETLENLFRLQVERSGYLVSSSFQVVPHSAFHKIPLQEKSGERSYERYKGYFVNTPIGSFAFAMGFIQDLGARTTRQRYQHTLPMIGLCDDLTDACAGPEFDSLKKTLARLYTYANHDYLHHLTVDKLRDDIATSKMLEGSEVSVTFSRGLEGLRLPVALTSYEVLMLQCHARNFTAALQDKEFGKTYFDTIENFFSGLEKLTAELSAASSVEADAFASDALRYLGAVGVLSLSRLLPMDHPAVTDCLERIYLMDPCEDGDPVVYIEKLRGEIRAVHSDIPFVIDALFKQDHEPAETQRLGLETLMVDCVMTDIGRFTRDPALLFS